MMTFPTALVAGAIVLLLVVIAVKRRARTSAKAARPRPNRTLAHSAQAGAVGSGLEWDFAGSFDQNDSDREQAACAESSQIEGDDASDPACRALDDSEEDNRCEDRGSGDTGNDTDCGSGDTD
jgi:hypothetical protein